MFAQRLIDRLFEAAPVEFEHQLAVELEAGPAVAILNVVAKFEGGGLGSYEVWGHKGVDAGQPELAELTYTVVALHDANGQELALTEDARRAIQASFDGAADEVEALAYDHLAQATD